MSRPAKILLLAGLALLFATRLRFAHEPLDRDLGTYLVIAKGLTEGRGLYTDLWDNKPPGIFWSLLPFVHFFRDTATLVLVFNLVFSLLVVAGTMVTAWSVAGPSSAALAGGLVSLLLGSTSLLANQPNTELVMNALLVWSYPAWLRAFRGEASRRALAGAGFLVGLAAVVKQVALGFGGLVLLGLALSRARKPRELAWPALTLALPWLLVFALFSARGEFDVLWLSVVRYSSAYVGSPFLNLLRGFGELRFLLPNYMIPLWGFCAVAGGVLFFAFRAQRPLALGLLTLLIGNAAMIVLPGRFYAHYAQLHLPWLALSAALVFAVSLPRPRICLGLAVLLYLGFEVPRWIKTPAELSTAKYGPVFTDSEALLDPLREKGVTETGLYLWGIDPQIYVGLKISPQPGVLWCEHVLGRSELQPRFEASLLRHLRENPPEWVLLDCRFCPCAPGFPPLDLIRSKYREESVGAPGHWKWYRRLDPAADSS